MKKMLTTLIQLSKNKYIEKETGYLICENAVLGSTGYQDYLAHELEINDVPPNTRIRVYRPAEEVFKPESLASLENKALVVLHPDEMVNSSNDSYLRKGNVYNVREEDGVIKGTIQVTDEDTINKTKHTKCLSLGYDLDLEPMEGEENAFIARNIRYNHLALVPKGRSKVAQINDASCDIENQKKEKYMSLFAKKINDAEKENDKDEKKDEIVNDEEMKAKDECGKMANDEEESSKERKDEERDEREGAEEDTVTKEIEKRVAKGDYTQRDLEKLLEKLKSKKGKEEIKEDYKERKKEEKEAKGKDSAMTLFDIDNIKDEKVKAVALDEYKANLMTKKGMMFGNDSEAFKKVENTETHQVKDAEAERRSYYRNVLNPHKNKDYKKEECTLLDVIQY